MHALPLWFQTGEGAEFREKRIKIKNVRHAMIPWMQNFEFQSEVNFKVRGIKQKEEKKIFFTSVSVYLSFQKIITVIAL